MTNILLDTRNLVSQGMNDAVSKLVQGKADEIGPELDQASEKLQELKVALQGDSIPNPYSGQASPKLGVDLANILYNVDQLHEADSIINPSEHDYNVDYFNRVFQTHLLLQAGADIGQRDTTGHGQTAAEHAVEFSKLRKDGARDLIAALAN